MKPLYSLLLLMLMSMCAYADGGKAADAHSNLYPWLEHLTGPRPKTISLKERFPTPPGYKRTELQAGSFGSWLRTLPVRLDRAHVLSYDHQRLVRPSKAIVLLDVGKRDFQQCADSIIRLHGEYLWHKNKAHKARYHFTDGQPTSWRGWVRGERFRAVGHRLKKYRGRSRANHYKNYRRWLTYIFIYAGTRSMKYDSSPVEAGDLKPGDFFVRPGGPGHAVFLLDTAVNESGQTIGLIGQGFMPAEDFHILYGQNTVDSVWFPLPQTVEEEMPTPSWPQPFRLEDARRFKVF
ncbi:MAG: DUF4846 domain-containing protein [Myxococcota bacterium]|nr:DUF4846 domain-containing protein [Myxococcota bacterium]